MTEKLPEGWVRMVANTLPLAGNTGYERHFGEHWTAPYAAVYRTSYGLLWTYWRQNEIHTEGDCPTVKEGIAEVDALHKSCEAKQLRLRRKAAQLLDGDHAALMVGEEGA